MVIFETVLARGPRFIIEQARELGAEEEELLREAGLSPQQIADPDARISLTKLVDFWRAVIRHLPERDLGVRLGTAFDLRKGGLVGYLALNSGDLREALERIVRFSRILNEAVRPRLEITADRGFLSWSPSPFFKPYPQVVDWGLAAILSCLRQASGLAFSPLEVRVHYPRPRPVPARHRAHFGSGLRFGRRRCGLVLSREQLDLPVREADTDLGIYLERHAEQVLRGLPSGGSLVARVRGRIWADLRQDRPSLARTAASLAMSARSLQRRLTEEGTSFSALCDEMRRDLATSLLRDRELAVHEISFLLGYSEPSTFYRAFRRWERISPARFRAAG